MLGVWSSPLGAENERLIKSDFKARGITESADAVEALTLGSSRPGLEEGLERTSADIWGNQILIVQGLSGLGDIGATEEDGEGAVYALPELFACRWDTSLPTLETNTSRRAGSRTGSR